MKESPARPVGAASEREESAPCVVRSSPSWSSSSPCWRCPQRRKQPTPPATSFRRATSAVCRRPPTRSTSSRSTTRSRPCAATSRAPTSTTSSCPRTSRPIGATHEENTGRPGLRLIYDSYGIPHVYGKTRADMAFGAGWTTARDRGLLIQLGRGPARVAVADVPGINAFGLVTSAQSFVPSPATEALVDRAEGPARQDLRQQGPPDPGRRPGLRRRRQRLLEGQQHHPGARDRQRRDRGDGLHRLDLRRRRRRRGEQLRAARQAQAGARRGARLQGLGRPDARRGSRGADHDQALLQLPGAHRRRADRLGRSSTRARSSRSTRASRSRRRPRPRPTTRRDRRLGGRAPGRQASNFQVVSPWRSATHNSLATMGPQLGYYYPEIVQQIDLHGPGIKAQGVAVPGPGDVHPDRAHEELRLEPDLGQPRRARRVRRAALQPRRLGADARLHALPLQGPVQGVRGLQRRDAERHPAALPHLGARPGDRNRHRRRQAVRAGAQALDVRPRRAQPGRAEGPDRGQGVDARPLLDRGQPVRLHFQLGVRVAQGDGVLQLGLPAQAGQGLDRRLPTLGTGGYDWQGFLSRNAAPARCERAGRAAAQLEQQGGAGLHAR